MLNVAIKHENWSRNETRHTLRTAMFRERERRGACRVATGAFSFCGVWKKTKQIINMKTLKLHCKYVYSVAGRDFVNASPLAQIELRRNMPRTNAESTNFEAGITNRAKSVGTCGNYDRHALKPCVL